jgi:pyruvate kinase
VSDTTGIVCTIGPAARSLSVLKKMVDDGMEIVRFNFSHGKHEEYLKDFELIKTLNSKCKKKVKILADLEGHRIRVGEIADGKVDLKANQKLTLTKANIVGNNKKIHMDYSGSFADIKKGMDVFVDDGILRLVVLTSNETEVVTEVLSSYTLKTHKGINIPKAKLKFPAMEEKDKKDMLFALEHNVDFVANSFVRNVADVKPLIDILQQTKNKNCKLIAKIEDTEGIKNLKKILTVVDGIMVARGDMGISIPIWQVPIVQKEIIAQCRRSKKIVITATQMLESMVENPIPTRAEVSDVANAIIDGTDYVMLSAESAVGAYPGEAVSMMGNIIKFTKKNLYRLKKLYD